MKHKTHIKQWLAIVIGALTMTATTAKADFADDINATTNKYGYGHRVIYEMNVGGFTTDGTFAAAQAKLTELKLTGVDVIWLMPIYPRQSTSPGINSPYGPVSYTKINPSYGTLADLKAFVNAAHSLNMEVWLDWVPNHTATNAEWTTSPYDPTDYYKYSGNTIVHPNNYGDVIQLDYNKQTLRNAMDAAMKYWIENADIDGFRCDYVSSSEIPADYWTWQIPRLRNYATSLGKSNFWMLGEANFLDNAAKKLFNTGWDYDYMWNFFEPTLTGMGSGTDASTLKTRLTNHFNQSEYSNLDRMAYMNNHDEDWNDKATMLSRYGDNRYAFNVLLFTFYGMPLIYNGQEIGYNTCLDYFNDTKINWNDVDTKMRNTIRTLTALKHSVEAFQDGKTFEERGSFTMFNTSNSVLAYKRKHGSSEAIVVMNFGTGTTNVALTGVTAGSYDLCLNSSTIASGVSKETVELTSSPTISVEARGYKVYVLGGISTEDKTYAATLTGNETAINKATFTMSATVDDAEDNNREVYGYYTTDGSEPTTNSTAVRHGDVITLTDNCTLKFKYRTNNHNTTLSETITKNVRLTYSTSENYSNYRNNTTTNGITVFLKTNYANPSIWGWETEGGADLNPGETWPGNVVTNTTESGWLYKTFNTNNLTFNCNNGGSNETGSVTITEDSHFLYIDGNLVKLDEYDQTASSKYVYFAQPAGNAWTTADVKAYSFKDVSNMVLVKDETGWENLYLYAYRNDAPVVFGAWPGATADATVTVNGTTYKAFSLDGTTTGDVTFIFNNGNGTQLADITGSASKTATYTVTTTAATATDVIPHDGYTMFVKNSVGWTDANLHLYSYSSELYGGWPGKSRDGSVTINGTTYSYFNLLATNNGTGTKFIVNNTVGGNANQAEDYSVSAIDRDLFLEISPSDGEKKNIAAKSPLTTEPLGAWGGTHLNKIGTLYTATGNTDFLRLNVSNVSEGEPLIFNNSTGATSVYEPYLDNSGETSVFFQAGNEGTYYVWAWSDLGGGENYTASGSYPGDLMTKQGQLSNGKYIYKWTQTKNVGDTPTYIIISNGNSNESTKYYDGAKFTNNGLYTDQGAAAVQVTKVGAPTGGDEQMDDVSCLYGTFYYPASSSTKTLSSTILPTGTKQEEDIRQTIAANSVEGDCTYLLAPTWNGSNTTATGVTDWTGNSVTVNTPAQNTAATQTVTVPAAATYMVQAIVRATAGKTITLSLNGSSQTITAIGMGNGTASQVDHNGRVDALYTGATGGWQKIEKSVTLAKDASLTISLMSDAASNEFQFSDVTLLKNPNTAGMFYTTAATTEATPFADLSNVNKFSFFDRGSNLNGLVVLGSSAVQNISGHEHPVNTIIKDGDNYTCQHLMFTDTDDSGQSWNNRNAFATNVAFTADKVSFNRQFAKQHTTLCLPYSLTAAQLNSLFGTNTWYAYKGVSENGSNIVFEEKTNTATIANQPMLIIPGNNGQLMGNGIEGEFAVSPMGTLSDTGFLPTYCWMEGYNDANYAYYLFNTEGNCVRVGNEGFDTKPFRAYIKIPASAAKETLMLEIETPAQEQTTYINKVEATSNGSNITYNTLGQIVGNSYRGIVIKNGKKTIQ
jgi:1,4-alpha-glucan branching enzyme